MITMRKLQNCLIASAAFLVFDIAAKVTAESSSCQYISISSSTSIKSSSEVYCTVDEDAPVGEIVCIFGVAGSQVVTLTGYTTQYDITTYFTFESTYDGDLSATVVNVTLTQSVDDLADQYASVMGGIACASDVQDLFVVPFNLINDHSPTFESESGYSLSNVGEGFPIGYDLLSFYNVEIIADDKDTLGTPASVIVFSISGDPDDTFSVQTVPLTPSTTTNGGKSQLKLSLQKMLNYDHSPYMLILIATDQGNPQLSTTTNLTITVEDIDNLDPIFEHEFYESTIYLTGDQSLIHLETVPSAIHAYDQDLGINESLTYEIDVPKCGAPCDALQIAFQIDDITGALSYDPNVDISSFTDQIISFGIRATQDNDPRHFGLAIVYIHLPAPNPSTTGSSTVATTNTFLTMETVTLCTTALPSEPTSDNTDATSQPPSTPQQSSTIPSSTIPSSTIPSSTIPSSTIPSSTIPSSTIPSSTIPSSTIPSSTIPYAPSTRVATDLPTSTTDSSFLTESSTEGIVSGTTQCYCTSTPPPTVTTVTLPCTTGIPEIPHVSEISTDIQTETTAGLASSGTADVSTALPSTESSFGTTDSGRITFLPTTKFPSESTVFPSSGSTTSSSETTEATTFSYPATTFSYPPTLKPRRLPQNEFVETVYVNVLLDVGTIVMKVTYSDDSEYSYMYAITDDSGESSEYFEIDSSSGVITTIKELQPSDYNLVINATAAADQNITYSIYVTILAVYEQGHIAFEEIFYEIEIDEGLHKNEMILDLNSIYEKRRLPCQYYLNVSSTSPSVDPFSINSANGQIYIDGTLNQKSTPAYNLIVTVLPILHENLYYAADSAIKSDLMSWAQSNEAVVQVLVRDINDHQPEFNVYGITGNTFTVGISSYTSSGQDVVQMNATDDDDLEEYTQILYFMDEDADFYVNENTGLIRAKDSLNSLQTAKSRQYSFTVTASNPVQGNTNSPGSSLHTTVYMLQDDQILTITTTLNPEDFDEQSEALLSNLSASLGYDYDVRALKWETDDSNKNVTLAYLYVLTNTSGPLDKNDLMELTEKESQVFSQYGFQSSSAKTYDETTGSTGGSTSTTVYIIIIVVLTVIIIILIIIGCTAGFKVYKAKQTFSDILSPTSTNDKQPLSPYNDNKFGIMKMYDNDAISLTDSIGIPRAGVAHRAFTLDSEKDPAEQYAHEYEEAKWNPQQKTPDQHYRPPYSIINEECGVAEYNLKDIDFYRRKTSVVTFNDTPHVITEVPVRKNKTEEDDESSSRL